jgi:hypothetical protein
MKIQPSVVIIPIVPGAKPPLKPRLRMVPRDPRKGRGGPSAMPSAPYFFFVGAAGVGLGMYVAL